MKETIFSTAVGCILALALWKESRENWLISLVGIFVIVATFHYADQVGFPLSLLVWFVGLAAMGIGKHFLVDHPFWKRQVKTPDSVAEKRVILP